jgi:Fe-S-cluster containining protein
MSLPTDHNGMFIHGMTDPDELMRFLQFRFTQEQIQAVYNQRVDESKALAQAEKITPLRAFWKLLGRAYEVKSATLKCASGCAHCCHTAVAATQLEWDGIFNHVRENNIDLHEIIDRAHKSIERVREALKSGKDLSQVGWHQLVINQPCPFLNTDNTCAVYEDRPLDCRLVVAYRDICASKNLEHAQRGVVVEEAVGSTVVARLQNDLTPKMKRRKFDGTQKLRLLQEWLATWQDKNKKKRRAD